MTPLSPSQPCHSRLSAELKTQGCIKRRDGMLGAACMWFQCFGFGNPSLKEEVWNTFLYPAFKPTARLRGCSLCFHASELHVHILFVQLETLQPNPVNYWCMVKHALILGWDSMKAAVQHFFPVLFSSLWFTLTLLGKSSLWALFSGHQPRTTYVRLLIQRHKYLLKVKVEDAADRSFIGLTLETYFTFFEGVWRCTCVCLYLYAYSWRD